MSPRSRTRVYRPPPTLGQPTGLPPPNGGLGSDGVDRTRNTGERKSLGETDRVMGWKGTDGASPSTGRSSGCGSSLGPFSEREQRMPGSHGHGLPGPVPQRSGRTVGCSRLTLGQSTAPPPPMGSGTLMLYGHPPPLSSHKEATCPNTCSEPRVQSHVCKHVRFLPSGDQTRVGRSFFLCARLCPRHEDMQGQGKALFSCCDTRSDTDGPSAGMPRRKTVR